MPVLLKEKKNLTQRAYIANELELCFILQQITGRKCVMLITRYCRLMMLTFQLSLFHEVRLCNIEILFLRI